MNHPLLAPLNTDENISLVEELQLKINELEKLNEELEEDANEAHDLKSDLEDAENEVEELKEEILELKKMVIEARPFVDTATRVYCSETSNTPHIFKAALDWLEEAEKY